MEHLEQYDYNGYRITIGHDLDPQNPRTEYDNIGEILYSSGSRYNLGDKEVDQDEMTEVMNNTNNIYLPVYAYIHSGIILSTGPFSCSWDSGQCGIIYVDRKDVYAALSTDNDERVYQCLNNEITEFSRYLAGESYCYTVEKAKTCETCDNVEYEVVDSCSGFNDLDYIKSQAKSAIDCTTLIMT